MSTTILKQTKSKNGIKLDMELAFNLMNNPTYLSLEKEIKYYNPCYNYSIIVKDFLTKEEFMKNIQVPDIDANWFFPCRCVYYKDTQNPLNPKLLGKLKLPNNQRNQILKIDLYSLAIIKSRLYKKMVNILLTELKNQPIRKNSKKQPTNEELLKLISIILQEPKENQWKTYWNEVQHWETQNFFNSNGEMEVHPIELFKTIIEEE